MNILKEIKDIENQMIQWRRELHRIPEIGLNLPQTSSYIKKQLDLMNISYKTLIDGNAIVALIQGDKEGKTIAIRADMDGLPIKEDTGLSFASENGNMHGCGHDGHMAILLATAYILEKNKKSIKGNIKLIFQPGEEYPGGAELMIKEGALRQPNVDIILGLHNGSLSSELEVGQVGFKPGEVMAAPDRFFIKLRGKGGHGAYPELTIDPIITGAELVLALQKIVSREISTSHPVVLSVTRIEAGNNHNIIPNDLEIEGTVRTFNDNIRALIDKRIEEIVSGLCLSNGLSYDYEYDYKYPALINNSEITKKIINSAKKIIDEKSVIELKKPLMGGEDMSFFLKEKPGNFFFLHNPKAIDGIIYPHHHPKFDIDEKYLWKGVAVFIKSSLDLLME